MSLKNNRKLKNILVVLLTTIVIGIIVFYLSKGLSIIKSYGFINILSSYNKNAKIIYFVICFLQPIVLPLPEPITIMGGSTVLGPLKGASIGFCGTILGIVVMFFVAKYAGRSIIDRFVDEKSLEKFNKYIQKNETLIILALFILPILPDEVICIGSGLAKINGYKFIAIASISKLITSISLSYSLELIKFDSKFIVAGIIVAISALVLKNKLSTK